MVKHVLMLVRLQKTLSNTTGVTLCFLVYFLSVTNKVINVCHQRDQTSGSPFWSQPRSDLIPSEVRRRLIWTHLDVFTLHGCFQTVFYPLYCDRSTLNICSFSYLWENKEWAVSHTEHTSSSSTDWLIPETPEQPNEVVIYESLKLNSQPSVNL